MRRVVITGIGMVSPLGANVSSTWQNLLNGKSGVKKIDSFDVSDLPVKIGAQVPLGDQSEKIPMGRFGVTKDVASCVLFLASDEASYLTGQTLHVNGGMVMV